jgi:predicted nuclease of predicted toxin-antitoxin system
VVKFAINENVDLDIIAGVRLRNPEIDMFDVRDVGLGNTDDRDILTWCANEGRILVTHDVNTLTDYAYERIRAGESMPGLVILKNAPIVQLIEGVLILAEASLPGELDNHVTYLPFR